MPDIVVLAEQADCESLSEPSALVDVIMDVWVEDPEALAHPAQSDSLVPMDKDLGPSNVYHQEVA